MVRFCLIELNSQNSRSLLFSCSGIMKKPEMKRFMLSFACCLVVATVMGDMVNAGTCSCDCYTREYPDVNLFEGVYHGKPDNSCQEDFQNSGFEKHDSCCMSGPSDGLCCTPPSPAPAPSGATTVFGLNAVTMTTTTAMVVAAVVVV